jgi:hypothetical protein
MLLVYLVKIHQQIVLLVMEKFLMLIGVLELVLKDLILQQTIVKYAKQNVKLVLQLIHVTHVKQDISLKPMTVLILINVLLLNLLILPLKDVLLVEEHVMNVVKLQLIVQLVQEFISLMEINVLMSVHQDSGKSQAHLKYVTLVLQDALYALMTLL